jgi:hypothetical protein
VLYVPQELKEQGDAVRWWYLDIDTWLGLQLAVFEAPNIQKSNASLSHA